MNNSRDSEPAGRPSGCGLPAEAQKAFITQIYEIVFQRKETGTESEIARKIEEKVGAFFDRSYRQDSNDVSLDFDQFRCHVADVNSRPDANFAIEFLVTAARPDGLNQVVVRVAVIDAATGKAISGVISCWEFNDEPKMVRCREMLADPANPDDPDYQPDPCGTLVSMTDWPTDVLVDGSPTTGC